MLKPIFCLLALLSADAASAAAELTVDSSKANDLARPRRVWAEEENQPSRRSGTGAQLSQLHEAAAKPIKARWPN
jgi:hypothetical protein